MVENNLSQNTETKNISNEKRENKMSIEESIKSYMERNNLENQYSKINEEDLYDLSTNDLIDKIENQKQKSYDKFKLNQLRNLLKEYKPNSTNSKEIYNLLMEAKGELRHEMCKEIYKFEVLFKTCVYSVSAPLHKLPYFILNERLNHFEEYKQFREELIKDTMHNYYNINNNYGISDSFRLSNLGKHLGNVKRRPKYNVVLDDKTIYGLINCEKQPLLKSALKTNKNDKIQTTLYIGKYNNQDVIFEEKICRDTEYDNEKNSTYSFGYYVNGNPDSFMLLFRADYKPNRTHFNKLSKQFGANIKPVNQEEFDVNSPDFDPWANPIIDTTTKSYYDQNEENPQLAYSHIHIASEKYSVLLPVYNEGIDCIYIGDNKIYDDDIAKSQKYMKQKFICQEDIEDYSNRYSIEQLDTFNKFVVFMRNIGKIDVEENKELVTTTKPFVKIEKNALYNLEFDNKFDVIAYRELPKRKFNEQLNLEEESCSLIK